MRIAPTELTEKEAEAFAYLVELDARQITAPTLAVYYARRAASGFEPGRYGAPAARMLDALWRAGYLVVVDRDYADRPIYQFADVEGGGS